jgi:hypothetical protein
MSAYAVFTERDRVHVATDTAGMDAAGKLAGFSTKTVAFPHINGVLACRGLPLHQSIAAAHIAEIAISFDSVVKKLPDRLKPVFCDPKETLPAAYKQLGYDGSTDSVWAGISEKHGPTLVMMMARPNGAKIDWRVQIERADSLCMAMSTIVFPSFIQHLQNTGRHSQEAFFELPALMQLMREYHDPKGHSVVGGAVHLTTITKDHMTTRKLMSWPDQIGQRINAGAPTKIDLAALQEARA